MNGKIKMELENGKEVELALNFASLYKIRGLKKDVGCNRIIEKEFIDTYFKNVKDKYKLISIDDIKEYSTTLFNSIN